MPPYSINSEIAFIKNNYLPPFITLFFYLNDTEIANHGLHMYKIHNPNLTMTNDVINACPPAESYFGI